MKIKKFSLKTKVFLGCVVFIFLFISIFILLLVFGGVPYNDWKRHEVVLPVQMTEKTILLPRDVLLELVYIPPGSFMMGSPDNELHRDIDEILHEVTLTDGFWIGKYEVTQAQWESVMGYNNSYYLGDNLPVTNLDWNEAAEFCEKLTLLEEKRGGRMIMGYSYTLPTEAQWEYTCRAGTTTSLNNGYNLIYLFWGHIPCPHLKKVGWSNVNSGPLVHEVGLKQPNAWGLYDMHGNVREWCLDWGKSYYTINQEQLPYQLLSKYKMYKTINPIGMLENDNKNKSKAIRGGSVASRSYIPCEENFCRSAARSFAPFTSKKYNLGFRICISKHDIKTMK